MLNGEWPVLEGHSGLNKIGACSLKHVPNFPFDEALGGVHVLNGGLVAIP